MIGVSSTSHDYALQTAIKVMLLSLNGVFLVTTY